MNHCSLGGYLVSGRMPLPADPIDYDTELLPRLGCNHLRCRACGAVVRNAEGLRVPDAIAKVDCAALYELPDLSSSPFLVPASGFRLYLCRCRNWQQTGHEDALADPDTDPFPGRPNVPWLCSGHPLAELPHEFDGVLVTAADLPQLIASALHSWMPAGAHPADRWGVAWAARMHVRLAGTEWADAVDRAAALGLEDPDPKARERALILLATVPLAAGRLRALEILERDRPSFAGVEEAAWRAIAPLVGAPGRARELARAEALAAGKGGAAVYVALASGDPEWVAAHADDIARATPAQGEAFILVCRKRLPGKLHKTTVERIRDALVPNGGKA
jgi:hypothetical protein